MGIVVARKLKYNLISLLSTRHDRDVRRDSDVFTKISSHPETNPTPRKPPKNNHSEQEWVKSQESTFTKWANNHLKGTGKQVRT